MRSVALVVALASCRSPAAVAKPAPETADAAAVSPKAASAVKPTTAVDPSSDRAYLHCKGGKTPTPPSSLREVDWCNLQVIPGYAKLHDGRSEIHEYEELGGPHSTDIFHLGAVAYGDLDGDGIEEAVVVIDQQSYGAHGGGYSHSELYVYAWKAGSPSRIADNTENFGARVSVQGGLVIVDIVAGTERCQHRYKLASGKLVPSAPPSCKPA